VTKRFFLASPTLRKNKLECLSPIRLSLCLTFGIKAGAYPSGAPSPEGYAPDLSSITKCDQIHGNILMIVVTPKAAAKLELLLTILASDFKIKY